MKVRFIIFLFLSACSFGSLAQKKQNFCGVRYMKKDVMITQLQDQVDFLKLRENDTIVDIGAASGWYEGAVSVVSALKNLHFILLDIDSACLNKRKLDNMLVHYSGLKGEPITHSFQLIQNSVDSLYLPANSYSKVWLLNVLHEIEDKDKMLKDVYHILRTGGEIVLLEFIPKKPGAVHGGCKKPLLNIEQWKVVFERNNFQIKEVKEIIKDRGRSRINMIRFVKW